MPRITSAFASPWVAMSAVLIGTITACNDGPTRPTTMHATARSATNVLSIGELRRAMPQTPCTAAPHRQFDFWIGEWYVSTDGSFDGVNYVTSELDGCLVAEHWNDVGEVKGWSLNAFDKNTGLWHQHWVDEGGLNLLLSGGLQNGQMIIVGTRPRLVGGTFTDRVTYTPLAGGQMHQLWEQSLDGGATFPTVVFDGHYDPQPGVVPPPAPGTTSCTGAAYRAADFLLGQWRVEAANGLELGQSSITAELSGCLVLEQFSTPKGYRAKSFLSFARAAAKWSRTYIDTEANRIFLQGTPSAGGLVLIGSVTLENGDVVMTRVTWTKNTAGALEQVWEVSHDGGATWSFDQKLVYVPA